MSYFFDILKEKFLSKQSNQFVLYGNTNDLYTINEKYVPLIEFLNNSLSKNNRIQINFNIADGISFFSLKDKMTVKEAYKNASFLGGSEISRSSWFDKALNESAIYPQIGIKFIEECLKLKIFDKNQTLRQFSIIIDYLETIAPSAPLEKLNDSDRQKIVTLSKWLTNPLFIDSPHLVIFICDTITSINENIINLPSIYTINIPRPDHKSRLNFIRFQKKTADQEIKFAYSQTKLASLTAGLSLKSIHQLFLSAIYLNEKLSDKIVIEKTNEIIKKELGDIIEIAVPAHNLKAVIGANKLKYQLNNLIKLIKSNNADICPVGLLATGPNGVGKTYIFEAFAKEIGYNIIKFKKLRSQWFGQTDVIFEKIKSILTSIGKVIVLIDEADTAFGGRSQSTHETEKRLFGNLIQMMGNPDNRGKIIWILITARPDKLEPDIKRSGRAGIHLPIFDPDGDERTDFIEWIFSLMDEDFTKFDPSFKKRFLKATDNYSPADFNELTVLINAAKSLNNKKITKEQILQLTQDFIPANLSLERRYQTLVAAKESSYKSLLPESLQNLEEINQELESLKIKLGY